jgi:hypothetical protein
VSATGKSGASSVATSADITHFLWGMTDSSGNSIGISQGDTLTYQLGNGSVDTFTVGASVSTAAGSGGGSTLKDLTTWLGIEASSASGMAATAVVTTTMAATLNAATGALTLANGSASQALTLGGNLAKELGLGTTVSAAASNTGSQQIYSTAYTNVAAATGSTLLANITSSTGTLVAEAGQSLTITMTSNGSSGYAGGINTINITQGMTVQGLINQIDNITGVSASIDGNGNLSISASAGAGTLTLGGTASSLVAAGPVTPGSAAANTLYAGYTSSAGGTPQALYASQFDTLRKQLDQLVADSSYQGVNLISGTGNSPLTVTFNNDASNPNQLVINAIDLSSTGMGLTQATSSASNTGWASTTAVNSTLALLTAANTTLRNASSTLGTNLTTVQTRQTFTTNLINTLQDGSGLLTNADMNQESANMLALQTQQQLGTSSLSLASQAAQSVLKLFP